MYSTPETIDLGDPRADNVGVATTADGANLPVTTSVIDETLRLYPSVWQFPRDAVKDDELAGHHIPAGSTVMIRAFAHTGTRICGRTRTRSTDSVPVMGQRRVGRSSLISPSAAADASASGSRWRCRS